MMRCLAFILTIYTGSLFSQNIIVTADRQQILIGDHLNFRAVVDAADKDFAKLDLTPIDTSKHFDLINPGEARKEEGSGLWIQDFVVTSFDSGTYYFPPIKALFNNAAGNKDVISNIIPISVGTVPVDSTGLVPIKTIIEEKVSWKDYLGSLWIVGLIVLLGFVLYWWNKSRDGEVEEEKITIYVPPHEKALDSLIELEMQKLWQQGDIKEFETEVSKIYRRYLEEKFQFPALEWTTKEIMHEMTQFQMEGVSLPVIHEVLTQSDMVKYAKSSPGVEAHQKQIETVRQWILNTKYISLEEE